MSLEIPNYEVRREMRLTGSLEESKSLQQLADILYPFWMQNLDGVVGGQIRPNLPAGQFRFFDACRRKTKDVWYLQKRVDEFDQLYRQLGEELLRGGKEGIEKQPYVELLEEGEYRYEAYWERLEFENLLLQAKACLDTYAKAVGSLFESNAPRNIIALEKVLARVRKVELKDLARMLSEKIAANKRYFRGIVLDPDQLDPNVKHLRDLVAHSESLDVYFRVRLPSHPRKEGVYGAFVDTKKLLVQNFKACSIAQKLWFGIYRLVTDSFGLVAEHLGKFCGHKT